MIEDLDTARPPNKCYSLPATRRRPRGVRGTTPGIVLLVFLLLALGVGTLAAHDTIDMDRANALLAAAEEATAGVKTARGSATEGEARFTLGTVLVEATDILNRDLAAHSGRLTVNAELLQKALAQRDLGPRFDEAIGRYRVPKAPLEEALRLSPEATYALRARFDLLKAAFYESFVLDPFKPVGIGFEVLETQIAEADALAPALSNADDAEEAAFINAVDLARAARLAPGLEARRAHAAKAQTALAKFAKAYPESMRAATASMLLKGIGGAE